MHVETERDRRAREERITLQIQRVAGVLDLPFTEVVRRALCIRDALDGRTERVPARRRH